MVRITEFGAKPADSRIELTQKDDALSVYIPSYGFNVATLFILGFVIFWTFGVFQWTWIVAALVPFPINVPLLLSFCLFWQNISVYGSTDGQLCASTLWAANRPTEAGAN
jgi:hypothetical protein